MIKPNRKVTVGALAGAIVFIIMYVLNRFVDPPIEAEVGSMATVIVTFILSYFINEPQAAKTDPGRTGKRD